MVIKISLPERPGNSPRTLFFSLAYTLQELFKCRYLAYDSYVQPRWRTSVQRKSEECEGFARYTEFKTEFLAKETAWPKPWTVW